MTAHVLDFSKQLSPDQLVCKEDQDATLAQLDRLPIGDFKILSTPPSLLKGHLAPIHGINVATLKLPEDLEVQQAGVGGLVVLIISLIVAACSKGNTGDRGSVGVKGDKGSKGALGESCKIVGYEMQCPDGSTIDLRTVPGIKGDKGDPGPKGSSGSTGPQGPSGAQGKTGSSGASASINFDECHRIQDNGTVACDADEFLLSAGCVWGAPVSPGLIMGVPTADDPVGSFHCATVTGPAQAYAVCCPLP